MTRFGSIDVDDTIACIIRSEAQRQGTDEHACMGIAMAESGFDPNAEGDNGRSIGLFQLFVDGGQGSDYKDNPDALKDPRLNAQIGIHAIALAVLRFANRGLAPDQYIREVARNSGHPGWVDLEDRRLIAIMNDYFALLFDPVRGLIAWPPNDPRRCDNVIPPPPPLAGWTEGATPQSKDQAQAAIERHFQRVNDLFVQF